MLKNQFSRNFVTKFLFPITQEIPVTLHNNKMKHQLYFTHCNKYSHRYYCQESANAVKNIKINQQVLPVNKYVNRTHTCGELTIDNVGEHVQLCGWMEFQRMGKFMVLRDSYGSTQLIIPDNEKEMIETVERLSLESVLGITGQVICRPPGQENLKMKTGRIEIQVETLQILNDSIPQLPFSIRQHNMPKESLQMQYRYLALRFPLMQKNLRTRSRIINQMRHFLVDQCGFVDVETPTLFKRTPGGAQEFVVPTQLPGKFYSLVQSPQQFKQLLMIGGIDRYFQIARCYRDEGARPDRQPEFTQLDIEMSFTDREGIISLVEQLLANSWPQELGDLTIPFKRYTYEDMMEMYGSDQPDLRIPYRIHNVTDLHKNCDNIMGQVGIYALAIPNATDFLTNSVKSRINKLVKENNFERISLNQIKISGDNWEDKVIKTELDFVKLTSKLNIKENDVLFIAYGDKETSRKLLGKIRVEFTNIMETTGYSIRSKNYEFLWIIDFPLFEKGDDANPLKSTHHPFTAPHPDDIHLLETDPFKVRGLHYDLVLNGSEIAGGSIRIHNGEFQQRILELLNIDSTEMTHLLDALKSGAPPHGGIAFGMDRLIAIVCDSPHIRNVIAFPKTIEGRDLMSGAPANISEEERKRYHLNISHVDEKNNNELKKN